MKFFLNLQNIPELSTKQDHYTAADNKQKAIHNFAVQIAQKKYSKDKWRTKIDDIKKHIKAYVTYVTTIEETKIKKSELTQIIKEEFEKIVKEADSEKGDVDSISIDKISTLVAQKLIRGRRNPTVVAPILSNLINKVTQNLQYDAGEFKTLFLLLWKQNKV